MDFSEKVIEFYKSISINENLPSDVEVLNPYVDSTAMELTEKFFRKYYNDRAPRVFLIGINPGRFGGGLTGIGFTDPVSLKEDCGIDNELFQRRELSSRFIYQMINQVGGPSAFFGRFFLTSVSPLGFVLNGKNLNYYDIPELQKSLDPFIIESFKTQLEFGAEKIAYSLGQGKNLKYLKRLNEEQKWFDEIRPLPHPRWVMQYRLKKIEEFIGLYQSVLEPWYKHV